MKKYSMVNARFWEAVKNNKIENVERTAYREGRGLDFDIYLQVWPNRASMARSIRMQERSGHNSFNWNAVKKLETTEGY